jgi:hypothetical protein
LRATSFAVWLYLRFTLSYRDIEDLLAERGLDVSYETVRRWVLKFGPLFARELHRRRLRPTSQWHVDEMAVVIAGRQFWLWRAIDDEGEGRCHENWISAAAQRKDCCLSAPATCKAGGRGDQHRHRAVRRGRDREDADDLCVPAPRHRMRGKT